MPLIIPHIPAIKVKTFFVFIFGTLPNQIRVNDRAGFLHKSSFDYSDSRIQQTPAGGQVRQATVCQIQTAALRLQSEEAQAKRTGIYGLYAISF